MNRYSNKILPYKNSSLDSKMVKVNSKRSIKYVSTTRNRYVSVGNNRIPHSASYRTKTTLHKLNKRTNSDYLSGKNRLKIHQSDQIEGRRLFNQLNKIDNYIYAFILELTTTKPVKKGSKNRKKFQKYPEGGLFTPKQEYKNKKIKSKGKLEKVKIHLMNCKFDSIKKVVTK